MSEIFGYATGIIIGLTLGIFGGGGSILSVPILVYLFKIPLQQQVYHKVLTLLQCLMETDVLRRTQ